jgi:hypothetical protein
VLVLVFGASTALGLTVTRFTASIGSLGSGDGQLSAPEAVAVNLTSHDIYVADGGNHRMVEFSSAGTFMRTFGADVGGAGVDTCTLGCVAGTPGSGPGAFISPTFVAVDNSGGPSAGDVYVGDTATNLVQKFDATGNLIASWGTGGQLDGSTATNGPFGGLKGIAIDGAGDLDVLSESAVFRVTQVFKFAQDGSFMTEISPGERGTEAKGLGVDGSGDFFKANGDGSVEKLQSDGTDIGQVSSGFSQASAETLGFGVDPGNGDLYNDIGGTIQRFSFTSCTPVPFSPCTPSETFGSGHLTSGTGLAVDPALNPSGSTVYAADAGAGQVQVFGPVVLPDVSTGAATNVAPASATLSGTVNPDGVNVTDCHFEYVTDLAFHAGGYTDLSSGGSVPCAETVGSGSSEVSVHADLSGLKPAVGYHYRLVAANLNGSNPGIDATLSPASIDFAAAQNVTATDADLLAKINPKGFDTTYHFEWGTADCASNPCTSVPVPDGDIGSATTDVTVTRHLSGLTANTTYHWRVLATNARGTTTGADHTFVYDTTSGVSLPDGRVYEMVTPAYTEGQVVRPVRISTDGTRFIGESGGLFAGAQNIPPCFQNAGAYYQFDRTAAGWRATSMSPPGIAVPQACMSDIASPPDLARTLWENTALPAYHFDLSIRQPDGTFTAVGPSTPTATRVMDPQALPEGVSDDLSHVVWREGGASRNVGDTFANPYFPFDPTLVGRSLMEYVGTGNAAPQLVAVTGGSGSTEVISKCGASIGGYNSRFHAMSADGRTVFFTPNALDSGDGSAAVCNREEPPVFQLFARIDQSRTVAISERSSTECTTGGCQGSPLSDANFEGASADGSKAFFTSTQRLLDTASEDPTDSAVPNVKAGGCSNTTAPGGCNLYVYDFGNPAGHELVLASGGSSNPRVQGVTRVSDDGSHVYFVAKGVLTSQPNAEGQTAVDGADNLYVFERDSRYPAGHTVFIAGLCSTAGKSGDVVDGACPSTDAESVYGAMAFNSSAGGPPNDQSLWSANDYRPAQATPDGRFLLFTSRGQLTPDTTGRAFQVFLYDAQTGALTRVSHGEHGFNDNGNGPAGGAADAFIVAPRYDPLGGIVAERDQAPNWRAMSDDGSYVFFQSPRALTPKALDDVPIGSDTNNSSRTNAYAQNVYEFHEGHVSLISDGRDTARAARTGSFQTTTNTASAVSLIGTDASGRDVFFTTADRLVSGDTNTLQDIYDARIGGGFAETAGSTSCQSGEACHQGATAEGSNPSPATPGVNGAGNLTPEPPPVSKPAARKRTKAVKGCRAVHNRHKRAVCERSARKHHGAKSKKAGHATTTRKGGK